MRILGVIPARGGSKRIPRKNLQVVGGMTLIERTIHQVHEAHLLDAAVVSSEDNEVLRLASKLWATTIARPPELAQDDTPMAPVLLHAAQATGGNWDAIVTIQPTSPLRTARDIDRCIAMWINTGRCFAASVNEETGKRNGAVYVTEAIALTDGYVFSESGLAYPMPAARSLDINEPSDLEEARRLLGP